MIIDPIEPDIPAPKPRSRRTAPIALVNALLLAESANVIPERRPAPKTSGIPHADPKKKKASKQAKRSRKINRRK